MPKAKHILIADGCALNRGLVRLVLGAEGLHRITEVEHYKEALSVLRAYKVHLLIMAQQINGVSGIDHIRQIRGGRAGGKVNIPIVVLLDEVAGDSRCRHPALRAMRAGATACVAKPFSIKLLHPVIYGILSKKDVAEAAMPRWPMIGGERFGAEDENSDFYEIVKG